MDSRAALLLAIVLFTAAFVGARHLQRRGDDGVRALEDGRRALVLGGTVFAFVSALATFRWTDPVEEVGAVLVAFVFARALAPRNP